MNNAQTQPIYVCTCLRMGLLTSAWWIYHRGIVGADVCKKIACCLFSHSRLPLRAVLTQTVVYLSRVLTQYPLSWASKVDASVSREFLPRRWYKLRASDNVEYRFSGVIDKAQVMCQEHAIYSYYYLLLEFVTVEFVHKVQGQKQNIQILNEILSCYSL